MAEPNCLHVVDIAGERLELLGERAVHWPRRRRLLVADLHLGKADLFRRAGIGLPRGGTSRDLQRLSALLDQTAACELWILGDMLHGAAFPAQWRTRWEAWRISHPGLRIAVLSGNHDRALACAGLDIELLGDSIDEPPFAWRHAPESHADLFVVCGHLHPQIRLPGMERRLPAFWLRERMLVLPAFSLMTGGSKPRLQPGDQLITCVDGEVVALPQVMADIA